ncbi:MAG: hypothetical protein CVT92_05735 [Bacteroidetes bacterium HGW-Bacteroidetes-1]|jgi:hypothetical protein|nr:MAG: hypothetical protein CVT92_05735 [Bacteroidetes bacterium HGW-Bacteroidetes-1]
MTELNFPSPNRRPTLLTVICVLSFIGSGMAAISNLFVFFNHETLIETINSGMFNELGFNLDILLNVNPYYFLLAGLLNVVSFVGVKNMWALRRAGFHLYAVSQLLILIISTVFIYKPSGTFPMFDLALASMFILLYLRFREIMD